MEPNCSTFKLDAQQKNFTKQFVNQNYEMETSKLCTLLTRVNLGQYLGPSPSKILYLGDSPRAIWDLGPSPSEIWYLGDSSWVIWDLGDSPWVICDLKDSPLVIWDLGDSSWAIWYLGNSPWVIWDLDLFVGDSFSDCAENRDALR